MKNRILSLFGDLAREIRDAVRPPCIELLAERFDHVVNQVRERLAQLPDPVERALEAIAPTEELRLAERQRRAHADRVTAVLQAAPLQAPYEDDAS